MEGYILQWMDNAYVKSMAGRHRKEERNHVEQDSITYTTIEGIDRGLHPAVDGQRLSKVYGRTT